MLVDPGSPQFPPAPNRGSPETRDDLPPAPRQLRASLPRAPAPGSPALPGWDRQSRQPRPGLHIPAPSLHLMHHIVIARHSSSPRRQDGRRDPTIVSLTLFPYFLILSPYIPAECEALAASERRCRDG